MPRVPIFFTQVLKVNNKKKYCFFNHSPESKDFLHHTKTFTQNIVDPFSVLLSATLAGGIIIQRLVPLPGLAHRDLGVKGSQEDPDHFRAQQAALE